MNLPQFKQLFTYPDTCETIATFNMQFKNSSIQNRYSRIHHYTSNISAKSPGRWAPPSAVRESVY